MVEARVTAVTLSTVLERVYNFLNCPTPPFRCPGVSGVGCTCVAESGNRFAVLATAAGGEADEDRQGSPPATEPVGKMSRTEKALDDAAVAQAAKAKNGAWTYQSKPFHRAERERLQRELDRALRQAEQMARRFDDEGRVELAKVSAQKGWMEGARLKRSRLEKDVADLVVQEKDARGVIELATLAYDVAVRKARDARGGKNPVWAKTKTKIAFSQEQELLLADVGPPAGVEDKPARNSEYVIPKRTGVAIGPRTSIISEEVVEHGSRVVAAFGEIRSRFPRASHTELAKLFHHENEQRGVDQEAARQATADVNQRASSLRGNEQRRADQEAARQAAADVNQCILASRICGAAGTFGRRAG